MRRLADFGVGAIIVLAMLFSLVYVFGYLAVFPQ